MSDYASEGGHFYTRDGEPAYTVISKSNGIERPTTLRDARKLDLVPGQSLITACAMVWPLVNWMIEQNTLSALTLPRMEGETEAAWLKRVRADAKEQGRKAAERGTAIHGALELHRKHQPFASEFNSWIQAVEDELFEPCGPQLWRAECCYAHRFGYGCKIDLHSDNWLIDYKSKDDSAREDLYLYDEHYMQLAACRMAAGIPQARCAIVFVGRQTPWAKFMEAEEKDLKRGWDCFEALLTYWQAKNGIER